MKEEYYTKRYYLQNKKHMLSVIMVFTLIAGAIVYYWVQSDRRIDDKNLSVEFAGLVEHVEYDVKQFPTITINNTKYYIGSGYNTNHQIETGDSLIKAKGSSVYKLIKHKTSKIVEFKN